MRNSLIVPFFLPILACLLTTVKSEAGFIPGPPPTSEAAVHYHHGKPLPPPSSPPPRGHARIVESYISSEFSLGSQPPPPPPPPPSKFHSYTSSHNSLPISESTSQGEKQPFEVVRAPVIYHQTVTDTDVTKALTDAFEVVDKLRKPGGKSGKLLGNPGVSSIEFVNHFLDNPPSTYATTTTTIVEAPHPQQNTLINPSQISITSENQQDLSPPPSSVASFPPAHDLPPSPVSLTFSSPTAASVAAQEDLVPVAPATSTSTSSAFITRSSPKLIIPSQPHVSTLGETVQSNDPQVRTIIQPVYIPYPVDQNGQPVGPLPDYQSMDFQAILSAQKQLIASSSTSTSKILLPMPNFQQQQHLSDYYSYQNVQDDQRVAAASPTLSTVMAVPAPTSGEGQGRS
ncbi:unnamed protein product [Orchesella dallaii]|uniref:Uncharacterized protein n=1 Tax=Orchesella dallaii TaxID=48710 RepID=A0ABP1RWN4_9HEXA